jgi:hypothetical protein
LTMFSKYPRRCPTNIPLSLEGKRVGEGVCERC